MSNSIQNAMGLVQRIAAKATNHSAGSRLRHALVGDEHSPYKLLEARKRLGQEIDASQIPGIVASIGAQIDDFNSSVVISKPTLEEVLELIAADGESPDPESE